MCPTPCLGQAGRPDNPFYAMPAEFNPDGFDNIDPGRGGITGAEDELGEFKIPTMRNLVSGDFPRDYMHNGYFKSLKDIIHFYNTRDLKPVCMTAAGEPALFVRAEDAIAADCWPVAESERDNIFDCGIPGTRDTEHCRVPLDTAHGETYENWCDSRAPTEGVRANPDPGIGNLRLTGEQEDEIVEYLRTLTDQLLIRPVEIEQGNCRGR